MMDVQPPRVPARERPVLICTPSLAVGGVERVASCVAEALNAVTPTVLLVEDSHDAAYDVDPAPLFLPQRTPTERLIWLAQRAVRRMLWPLVRWSPEPARFFRFPIDGISDAIRHIDPRVLVLNAQELLYAPELRRRFPHLPIILWLHNSYDVYFLDYYRPWAHALTRALQSATCVVALTAIDRLKYGRHASRCVCIHNPLTLTVGDAPSDLNTKQICFVGRYSIGHKGIDRLVSLAQRLPPGWQIAMAGSGSPAQVRAVDRLIARARVQDRIVQRGSLQGEALAAHYRSCSAFVMTSRWEGFPLVLAEAMAAGLPIVAFHNGGSDEILEDGRWGMLIEQGDVQTMAAQINSLAGDTQLRRYWGQRSLARVQDFTLGPIIQQWVRLIAEAESLHGLNAGRSQTA